MDAPFQAAGGLWEPPAIISSRCTKSSPATPGSLAASPARNSPKATRIPPLSKHFRGSHGYRAAKPRAYGVVLDAHGKIGWNRSDIGGDPIVAVLSESVADAPLAGLRGEGVHYIFAGKSQLDLALTLDILNRDLGVKRLLVEGGGATNGAFLRAGLVDEINLIVCPGVDGTKGAPSAFDATEAEGDQRAPIKTMTLESSRALDGGAVLLKYRIQNEHLKASGN